MSNLNENLPFKSEAEYIQALQRHDWDYEFSDDGWVWRRGRDEHVALYDWRERRDPDFRIWNQFAPQWRKVLL
jgi:hypothetical protein